MILCNDLFRKMEWMKKLGFVQGSFISGFKNAIEKQTSDTSILTIRSFYKKLTSYFYDAKLSE